MLYSCTEGEHDSLVQKDKSQAKHDVCYMPSEIRQTDGKSDDDTQPLKLRTIMVVCKKHHCSQQHLRRLRLSQTLPIDHRARVLSNARVLYPHILQAHLNRNGPTALESSKIFDIVYCTEHVPQSHQTRYRACLIYREPDSPSLRRRLIRTAPQANTTAEGLDEMLFDATVQLLKSDAKALLPIKESSEARRSSIVEGGPKDCEWSVTDLSVGDRMVDELMAVRWRDESVAMRFLRNHSA